MGNWHLRGLSAMALCYNMLGMVQGQFSHGRSTAVVSHDHLSGVYFDMYGPFIFALSFEIRLFEC